MSETIEENGACLCRSVKFKVSGTIVFNGYCHCKSCSHSRGMSPVHLIGVTPAEGVEITEGAELLTTAKGYGKMRHTFCSKCGCLVYQYPEGANFRALLPTNFHIEDGINCTLPDKYRANCHVNYENRQMDSHDPLPKFKTFPWTAGVEGSGIMMNNHGKEISSFMTSQIPSFIKFHQF